MENENIKKETGHPAQYNYNKNEVFGGIFFFLVVLVGMYFASNIIN